MKAKPLILSALLVVLLALTVACGGGQEATPASTLTPTPTPSGGTEGALPTLHLGDRWVFRLTSDGDLYTETDELIGQEMMSGKDCYVTDISFDPPFMGMIDSGTMWTDKATLDEVKVHLSDY